MNWLKHLLLSTLTVFISAIIGIIIVELIGSHLLKSDTLTYGSKERFIFYSDSIDGNIFKNIGRFFLYEPRARIRNVTYYLVNGVWIKEFDYYFGTNNLGLVQTSDIDLNKKSILLLGDSFTQGIGSPPWTDELSKEITNDKYQIVNGGILGGGFAQWSLLHQYLIEKGVKVWKLAVIFISDDYTRKIWNLTEKALGCLKDSKLCKGIEYYLRLPNESNIRPILAKYYKVREKKKNTSFMETLKESFTEYFPTISRSIETFATEYDFDRTAMNINRDAVDKFISTYNDDVIFIHIPQREEVISDGISPFGLEARNKILAKGGHIFDGFKNCGLTKEDYYVHDGHPNPEGYKKISKCVYLAISEHHWVD